MFKELKEEKAKEFNKEVRHPLQTWEWGEFRKKTGNEILRLGKLQKTGIKSPMQLTIHPIPGIKSLKVAALIKGPKPDKESLEYLQKIAKNKGFIFVKMEPNIVPKEKEKDNLVGLLKKEGAVQGRTLFTPSSFWIDLTKEEKDLLSGFHSKTRYNIRYAARKGVEVKEDNSDKAFEKYLQLTRKTVERQGFYAHTKKYHRLMWNTLHTEMVKKSQKPIAHLLTATYKKEVLTAWVVFIWKNFLYYPYGASSMKHKNLQANSLMMWEAIRFGKMAGLKTFDLWGREPGKGFTHFKEGFNPKVVKFLGTWDLVTSSYYYPYRVSEKLRWLYLRGIKKIGILKPKFG